MDNSSINGNSIEWKLGVIGVCNLYGVRTGVPYLLPPRVYVVLALWRGSLWFGERPTAN